MEPFGVLVAEIDDGAEVYQFLESVQCFGMGSEQGCPDVGIVGDDALAAEFLECCFDVAGAW